MRGQCVQISNFRLNLFAGQTGISFRLPVMRNSILSKWKFENLMSTPFPWILWSLIKFGHNFGLGDKIWCCLIWPGWNKSLHTLSSMTRTFRCSQEIILGAPYIKREIIKPLVHKEPQPYKNSGIADFLSCRVSFI